MATLKRRTKAGSATLWACKLAVVQINFDNICNVLAR